MNTIRTRAGLSEKALYTVDDLKNRGRLLNVVLEERRIELAFEGHRPGDLYRNTLRLVRACPGLHGIDNFHFRVEPTSPRIIFYIPEREANINKNLVQNP